MWKLTYSKKVLLTILLQIILLIHLSKNNVMAKEFLYTTVNTQQNSSKKNKNVSLYNTFVDDTKYTFSSALEVEKYDFIKIGTVLGVTGTLMIFDEDIRKYLGNSSNFKHNKNDHFVGNFEPFGNGKYIVPGSIISYAGGHFVKNQKLKETSFMVLESFLISGAFTQILKHTFSRSRPWKENGSFYFEGPAIDKGNSFPSGHTTSAFSTASVVSEQYDNIYLSTAMYSFAGLTGAERIYDDAHWASDVFLGAVIGIAVGKAIVGLNKNKTSPIKIYPAFYENGNYPGLQVFYYY